MILMGANPFRGPLKGKGVGLKNQYFLGPEIAPSEASAVRPKKAYQIKNRYIGNFKYMSLAAAVFCILCSVL